MRAPVRVRPQRLAHYPRGRGRTACLESPGRPGGRVSPADRVLQHLPAGDGRIVYFAHSMRDYDTAHAAEARAVILAARPGCRLLDPSTFGDTWMRLVEELGRGCTDSHRPVYELVVGLVDEVIALEHA